jgi:beta-lactam-binding protein with PASTA domain
VDRTIADPLVGTVLDGRYRIRGRIARGGMATVYDAVDERLERTVAIKVMHPSYAADPLFIDRFIREAKSTARLNHPNVVAVFDQGSHDDLAFLVMEQVQGDTLRDLLNERGRLSIAESVSVLTAVLDALAAAHRSGLVHRDVKPENVLIGADGVVKVADFGLARVVESSKHTATGGVVMGTVAYVSPEQIISGQADARSDVYSAGIMFFEMLTGTVPFGGDSAVNIAFQHVNNHVPATSERVVGVPPRLDELVHRATRREPRSRPADAGAFLAELRMISEELGLPRVTVSASTARPRPDDHTTRMVPRSYGAPTAVHQAVADDVEPPRRRNTALIAVGVLLALGLVAASLGWWLGAGRFEDAPSLVTLTQQQAEQKAKQAGFEVKFGTPQFSATAKEGTVLSQSPKPKERILSGGTITLILSKGPEIYEIPDVARLEEAAAKQALTDLNFVVTVKPAFDDDISQGNAIGTDPKAGTKLKPGSPVTLLISNGTKPIELKDLRGLTKEEAEKVVVDLGLKVEFKEQEVDDDEFRGRVISQDPGPGNVSGQSTVTLTIGAGDAKIEVPNLQGKKFSEAREELEDLGLEIRRAIGRGNGRVFIQFPAAGTQVDAGSTVSVGVSGDN